MAVLNFVIQDPAYTVTSIPNVFFDKHMPGAPSSFVIVYLWAYRHAHDPSSKKDLTSQGIGKTLNLLESDVINAWKYWEQEGLVQLEESADGFSIQFLAFNSKTRKRKKKTVGPVVAAKPVYSTQEMDMCIARSKEFKDLLTYAENKLGKLLDYNDISCLLSFQDWLMLPVEVIELLLDYCAGQDHRSIRYIEKVALDWASKGLDSKAAAQEYIKSYQGDYREIMKALGIKNREPIEAEIQYMDKWLGIYGLPFDVVKEACTKTVLQTGRGSFAYADGILSKWADERVQSLDDVKEMEQQYTAGKQEKANRDKKKPIKKNRFVNFEQRQWNFKEIEQMEEKHIQQLLDQN